MKSIKLKELEGLNIKTESLKKTDLKNLFGGATSGSTTSDSTAGGISSGGTGVQVCICACGSPYIEPLPPQPIPVELPEPVIIISTKKDD